MITKFGKYKKSRKKDLRSIFYFVLLGVFIFGVISFLVVSNWRISQKRADLRLKIEELTEEIEVLEARKEQLEAGVYQSFQDEYWEEKIREQGYKKPGEEAVVIKKEIEEKENQEEKEKSFLDKFLEKFKRD
ncbi:septum formation initiator family protein [Candidatus Parcubacteria bacterium]|nr:septum formation initiator family protein [Candidatus Parcubacteria bacterium]